MNPILNLPASSESASKSKILCVDDEISIINILTRGLSDQFEVYSALNGPQGLELLKQHPDIVVILSDQKMLGMNGIEFLIESQKINPDPIRIMITAYPELQLVMDSINRGHVYQFILKPFDMESLRVMTMRAVEHYHALKAFERAYNELQAAQEQLIRSERMSALGRLMSSISHELGAPISNINQAAILAQMEWDQLQALIQDFCSLRHESDIAQFHQKYSNEQIHRLMNDFEGIIRTVKSASQYTKEIIQDLRGVSRMDDSEWMQVDIHPIIERSLHLMQTKYKYQIEFHTDFSRCPLIIGLSGPLTQVFLNLIQNAAQAIPDKGHIWISTRSDEDYVHVHIRDNGTGIAPEHKEKIFQFGFTTKGPEEGTGLGLTIVTGIIEKHHGKISFTSELGKGTEFIVSLPVRRKANLEQKN